MLQARQISLSARKSYLGYPSVKLLGQCVNALGLATSEEKLVAIANLEFLKTLAKLETYLGLTDYLRQYIPQYSAIIKPLQERKLVLQKAGLEYKEGRNKKVIGGTPYGIATPRELDAFHHLQSMFKHPTVLIHFDPKRRLYIDIDASKEWGFGASVYHCKDENRDMSAALSQMEAQPILFLSRQLTDAEQKYWPTELEVAGLVWVIRKTRHLIESTLAGLCIVYTDHSATIAIARQSSLNTASIEKLNLRLIQVSEYIQRFLLDIRYRAGRTNTIPDTLSRLSNRDYRPEPEGPRKDTAIMNTIPIYITSLVEMSDEFKRRLKEGYEKGRWARIIEQVEENNTRRRDGNATEISYKLTCGLLYVTEGG